MKDWTKFKDQLPIPKDLNNTKVKITIRSTGQISIMPWNEVSRRGLEKGKIEPCYSLYKWGRFTRLVRLERGLDRVTFEVIK